MNQRVSSFSPRTYLLLTTYLLLFAFALRTFNLNQTSLWIDDILTYQTLSQADSIDGFLQGMIERKIHVPAYFAVSSLYPAEHSDFSLRYPNVLWSLLTIAVLMRLTGRLYRRRELALLVGGLLVLHPHFILLSREARPYPMSMLLTTLSSYLFLLWISRQSLNLRQTTAFTLTSLVTYLTHYATLVLIPAQLLYLLWGISRKQITHQVLVKWMVIQALALTPTLIWEVFILSPRRDPSVLTWILPVTPDRLWQGIVQLYMGFFPTHQPGVFQVAVMVIGILGFLLFIRRIRYGGYGVLLTIVPLIGLVLISQIRPLFYARYLSVTQPFYLLTLVLGWWQIWEYLGRRRLLRWGLAGLVALSILNMLAFSTEQFQTQSYARREWREAMAYIEANAQAGDVIVTAPSYIEAPEYYATRDDLIILQADAVNDLIRTYNTSSTPPFPRMWFIITPEGLQLQGVARYYGTELELFSYTTNILLVADF